MLHRTMQRALRSDARGAPPRMSLLLDNRCPHHAYRDEMRDMLIGRDHSVWKVHASSIVCVETLVTPPPAPLNLERSLERYAEHLVRRAQARRPPARARPDSATLRRRADAGRPIGAVSTSPRARPASARRVPALLPHACRAARAGQEHQEEERTLRPPPGAPSRRGAAAAPSRRAEAPPQTCSADDVARGEEACAPAAGARDPAEMPLSPPLRVAVIQRTSQERHTCRWQSPAWQLEGVRPLPPAARTASASASAPRLRSAPPQRASLRRRGSSVQHLPPPSTTFHHQAHPQPGEARRDAQARARLRHLRRAHAARQGLR